METLEQKAQALGNDKQALRKRLIEARSCLKSEYRREFKTYKFDFDNKRLVSSSGLYALVWQVRLAPDEEISYRNQQTANGFVYLTRIK